MFSRYAPVCGLAMALVALGWPAGPGRAEPPPVKTSTARPLYPVGVDVRAFVDPARPDWRTRGPRPLATVIWYPAPDGTDMGALPLSDSTVRYFGDAQGAPLFKPIPVAFGAKLAAGPRRPLILLSHGSTGLGLSLEWLAHALAERGYIVAAVNHHGNTIAEGTLLPQGFGLPWERADDLSAVLTDLLHDPVFGPAIDPHRIGAAGHSAGGETVIAMAGGRFNRPLLMSYCASAASQGDGTCEPRDAIRQSIADIDALAHKDAAVSASLQRSHASHKDARVRAVFAMAPAMGPAFEPADLKDVDIPVAIVVGDADDTAPAKSNAARFAGQIRGAKLSVLHDVGHLTFSSECSALGMARLDGCRDLPGIDRAAVQRAVADQAYAFFESAWPHPKDKPLAGRRRAN